MRQNTRFFIYILIAVAVVIMGTLAILQNRQSNGSASAQEHIDLGRIYLTELSYEKAALEFTRAIEIEPLNPDAYLGLAEAYVSMGDTEKAREVLEDGYNKTGDERLRDMLDGLLPPELEATTVMNDAEVTVITTEETTETIIQNIENNVESVATAKNNMDYIKIISVIANGRIKENENCSFTVTIEYNLSSCENGIIYVGFNNDKYDIWSLTEESVIISEGTNTITITTEANAVYWNGILMNCYVNLSEYPHESSWSPLASDFKDINAGESTVSDSQYYVEDFLGMTYKEVFQILGEGKLSCWNGGWGYYWKDLELELTSYQNEVIINYQEKTIIPEEAHVGLVYTWSESIPANKDLIVGMRLADVVNKYDLTESDIYTLDIDKGYNLFVDNKYSYSIYMHTSGENDYNEPITEIALQAKDYYEKRSNS